MKKNKWGKKKRECQDERRNSVLSQVVKKDHSNVTLEERE
jgi:hypothetical protein